MKTQLKELLFDRVAAPVDAPFEALLVVVDGLHLCAIDFAGFEQRMHRLLARRYQSYRLLETRNPVGATDRLQAYLDGDIHAIDVLPVKTGGTDFQAAAWQALRSIAPGSTATYSEQAARVGRPAAVRAIGAANGQNPIAIVLPCHRVLGANGSLTGYAGGLAAKQWLLRHELAHYR